MTRRILPLLLFALCLCTAGCSSKQPQAPEDNLTLESELFYPGGVQSNEAISLDDYDDDDEYAYTNFSDPLEPWNRVWFRFNDVTLLYVIKPVYTGYATVTPEKVRSGISNFAYNLKAPLRMLNSILQGKFAQTGVEFGKFFINTITSLGFADVAQRHEPRYLHEPEKLNFGHTLAYWGIPSGPYLVWPLLGPSTVRGSVGSAGDAFLSPETYVLNWPTSLSTGTLFTINGMGEVISGYETMRRMALEPYAAVRNGYFSLIRQREAGIPEEPGFRQIVHD